MEINNISVNNTEHKKDIYAQKLLYIFRECILRNRFCEQSEMYLLTDEGINIFKEKIKNFVNESMEKDIVNKMKAIQSIKENDLLIQDTSIQNFFTTNGEIELVKGVVKKINVHEFGASLGFDELNQKYFNKTICESYRSVRIADGSWVINKPFRKDISDLYKIFPFI